MMKLQRNCLVLAILLSGFGSTLPAAPAGGKAMKDLSAKAILQLDPNKLSEQQRLELFNIILAPAGLAGKKTAAKKTLSKLEGVNISNWDNFIKDTRQKAIEQAAGNKLAGKNQAERAKIIQAYNDLWFSGLAGKKTKAQKLLQSKGIKADDKQRAEALYFGLKTTPSFQAAFPNLATGSPREEEQAIKKLMAIDISDSPAQEEAKTIQEFMGIDLGDEDEEEKQPQQQALSKDDIKGFLDRRFLNDQSIENPNDNELEILAAALFASEFRNVQPEEYLPADEAFDIAKDMLGQIRQQQPQQEDLWSDEALRQEMQRKLDEQKQKEVEAERKAQEEAQRKAEEEAQRKAQEEAQRKAQEEAQRKAQEEAQRKAQEEAQRKAQEEAQRKAQEEAQRKAQEEAQRKAQEEAQRKAQEEAQRKAQEEAQRKAQEEQQQQQANELKAAETLLNKAKEQADKILGDAKGEAQDILNQANAAAQEIVKLAGEEEQKAKEAYKKSPGYKSSADNQEAEEQRYKEIMLPAQQKATQIENNAAQAAEEINKKAQASANVIMEGAANRIKQEFGEDIANQVLPQKQQTWLNWLTGGALG